ncbi:TPA: hypothetical protein ACMU6X_000457 [Clostridioides difficile]|nr:hypothetical protein [Clostridioides difficile]
MLESARVNIKLKDLDELRWESRKLRLLEMKITDLMEVRINCGNCKTERCESCHTKASIKLDVNKINKMILENCCLKDKNYIWLSEQCKVEEIKFIYDK